MAYLKKLGVFVKIPEPGSVKTRLVPPLSSEEACGLYRAFLLDLFARLSKLKKISATVFHGDGDPALLEGILPDRFDLVAQEGETLGERMESAFRRMLDGEGGTAIIIGSDSPDIPLAFLKRAYLKLKHHDVVLGPAVDGGYYLVGLKQVVKPLFNGINWGTATVLRETLEKIETESLSCSLLPLWYDVDDSRSLALLESMLLARRIERSYRLHHTERFLTGLKGR